MGEPVKEAADVREVVFDGDLRESFLTSLARGGEFEKEALELVE